MVRITPDHDILNFDKYQKSTETDLKSPIDLKKQKTKIQNEKIVEQNDMSQ